MVGMEQVCSKCGKPGEFRPGSRQCRECEKAYHRVHNAERVEQQAAYRVANRERYRIKLAEINRRRRAERHAEIDRIKSVPCAGCGGSFPPYVMDFDHRDPSTKKSEVSFLINKTGAPWSSVLEEVAKCDVVCANCHRMRTQTTDSSDKCSQLVASLKNTPCVDCGGIYHYCQMDFDHVRGNKLAGVSRMTTKKSILEEASKCEVVCANCHRERSHKDPKGEIRLDPGSVNMDWECRSSGPQTNTPVPNDVQKVQPWHGLVGKVTDRELARRACVSFQTVFRYRRRMGIERFVPTGRKPLKPRLWHSLLGTMTDKCVSETVGVPKCVIFDHRKKLGIPSFRSSSKQMKMETAHAQ